VDWNSEQYLKFKTERTQPAIDLVNRIKRRQGDGSLVLLLSCAI